MRPLWKGAISFGLVTIPVSLYPATRREELKFRMLRKRDHSPINYKRVAEADGKEVPWDEIVKEKIEHGDKAAPSPPKKKRPSSRGSCFHPSGKHSTEPGKGQGSRDNSPAKVEEGE